MHPIKLGIAYDVLTHDIGFGDDFGDMMNTIAVAEDAGLDSVWLGETHRRKPGHGHAPAPLVLAGAIAARTQRLTIGTAVLLLPAYTPLQIAEQVALLDQITRGRMILGVAPGLEVYRDFGYENIPVPKGRLQSAMDEGIEIIRRLWSQPSVTFDGRFHRYVDAACVPGPYGDSVPILVGGITDRSLDRAAVQGDGWIGGTPYPLPLIERVRRGYLERCTAAGRAPGAFALIRPVIVATTDDEARELAERHVGPLIDYYLDRGAFIKEDRSAGDAADPTVREQAWNQIPIVGSPETCAQQLNTYVDRCGVDHFLLRVRHPGLSHERTRTIIRLLAEEVAPQVRAAMTPSKI